MRKISGGKAVDTVGVYHVFKQLCSRKERVAKLSSKVMGIMKGIRKGIYEAGETMFLVRRGLVHEENKNKTTRTLLGQ